MPRLLFSLPSGIDFKYSLLPLCATPTPEIPPLLARLTASPLSKILLSESLYPVTLPFCLTSAVIVFDIQDNGIIIRNTYLGKTGSSYDATRGTMINNILYVVNNIGIVSYDINEKWNDHISYIVF